MIDTSYIVDELAFTCRVIAKHLHGNPDSRTYEDRDRIMAAIIRARADLQSIYSRLETEQYVAEVDG